jgi:hypothetical protein
MIESAAEMEANTLDDSASADLLEIPLLELRSGMEPRDVECYQLDEVVRYHDREFVANLYVALRKRAPTTAELAGTLDDLRSGRRTKVEIIESLLSGPSERQPPIRVAGLSSPIFRRVGRWPFVGYLLRMLSAFMRLPVLIKHQQEFEAYALGQQQDIADYLNVVLAPTVKRHENDAPVIGNLSVTVADTIDSVLILSDALVDLSGRLAEFQTELRVRLEQLQAQESEQTQTQTRLEADVRQLTEAHTLQRDALEETQRAQTTTAAAQQEFLIQEQRVIVETQKVVLGELQMQLEQLLEQQRHKNSELAAQVHSLQALIGAAGPQDGGRAAGKRIAPKPEQA